MRSYSHRPKPLAGWKRTLLIIGSVIVGLMLFVLLAGSPIAKAVLNHRLEQLPEYRGHVGKLQLQLWRGGVEIGDFVFYEREYSDEVPLLRAKRASLAISWPALFHGKIGGRAVIENLQATVVKREATLAKNKEETEEEKKQKAAKVKEQTNRWREALARALPLEVSKFEIRDGTVRFIDRTKQPEVDIALGSLQVTASGLTNRPTASDGSLPARVDLQGTTTGNGKLKITAQADPLATAPRFSANLELRELQLPAFNSFLLAYTDADVSRGSFELFVEMTAASGAYEGYVKPLFTDLDFTNPSDKDKTVAQRVKEKVVSAVSSVLKNDEEKKVATKAPFAGNFADNKVDVWTTIVNLLRNAFVQGLRGGFEGQPTPKPAGRNG